MKYSFIVPVYGTQAYLADCVASILAQKERDMEVILVDDRSPDGCPALCDALAEKDGRVRVIHKERNEGLGPARNTGLAAATGDFVIFIDSDDRVTEELLSVCGPRLTDETDVLVFGVIYDHENARGETKASETLSPKEQDTARGDKLSAVFLSLNETRIFPYAWNKIYRRSFLEKNGLLFESTELIEDFLFNIAVFSASPRVTVIPDALYRYRRRAGETLVSKYSPRFFELCKRKYTLERGFLTRENALDDTAASFIAFSHIKHVISVAARNRSKKARLSVKRQGALAREMLLDPLTKQALSEFIPAGTKQRLIADRMKKEDAVFLLTLAAAVDLIRRQSAGFFEKYVRK